MDRTITDCKKITVKDVQAAIAFDQPKMNAASDGSKIVVEGTFLLFEDGVSINSAGPMAEFNLKIVVPDRFPDRQPKVFETGGRIPRTPDRHINPKGDCCITVWEHWRLTSDDLSFGSYLRGPVSHYFLGQLWFERHSKWPFGERSHGTKGLREAYAELLGIPNKKNLLLYYLALLSQDWPKGHWSCPCGSGKRLRNCHRDRLKALHQKIPPQFARSMFSHLVADEPFPKKIVRLMRQKAVHKCK